MRQSMIIETCACLHSASTGLITSLVGLNMTIAEFIAAVEAGDVDALTKCSKTASENMRYVGDYLHIFIDQCDKLNKLF